MKLFLLSFVCCSGADVVLNRLFIVMFTGSVLRLMALKRQINDVSSRNDITPSNAHYALDGTDLDIERCRES